MAIPCGLGFSQHGCCSKKKEAEAARLVESRTQELQNITFTVSEYSDQPVTRPASFMEDENKPNFSMTG